MSSSVAGNYRPVSLSERLEIEDAKKETKELEAETEAKHRQGSFFTSPVVFAALGMAASALWLTGISYLGGTVSTIEKRLQLKSSESGLFPVVNDCFGLVTMLFIIHFGQPRHRPRIIAVLYMIVALGYFLHSVPHFLYDLPDSLRVPNNELYNKSGAADLGQLCLKDRDISSENNCSEDELAQSGPLWNEAMWIIVGQALCSCGTCVYPLFITYLDDCVRHRSMGLYLGALFSTIAIGSSIGYGLATLCLHLPNFLTKTDYDLPTTPDDPRWLGNWWLGFIITGTLIFFISIPLLFFPRHLPKPIGIELDTESTDSDDYVGAVTHGIKSVGEGESTGFLRGLVASVGRILTNMTVICLILCTTTLSGFIAGFQLFGAKYIQYQFSFEPDFASILFGLLLVPAGIFGNIIGGYIVKRYAHGRHGLAKMILICSMVCLVLNPTTLLFGCHNNAIAGLTIPVEYNISELSSDGSKPSPYHPDLTSQCNEHCGCSVQYDPVCGADGKTYPTPCHAGCTDAYTEKFNGFNRTVYFNCACTLTNDKKHEENVTDSQISYEAVEGECNQICLYFIPFAVVYVALLTAGIMCGNPIILLEIRSVEQRDRSMTIAVGNFLGKLFGYIPGPIYFGAIIDTACLLFQTSCGETGNCLIYDVVKLRHSFNGVSVSLQVVAIIFVMVAFYSIKCHSKPNSTNIKYVEEEQEGTP